MKNSRKISTFLFMMALLFILVLGSCAKTELDDFDAVESVDQNKLLTNDVVIISERSDEGKDDCVTDDEDDDEEEEDDRR